jgi:hypothetical protein
MEKKGKAKADDDLDAIVTSIKTRSSIRKGFSAGYACASLPFHHSGCPDFRMQTLLL